MVTASILCGRRAEGHEDRDRRRHTTALRQAGAIAAVGGERSMRRMLGLAHDIYDSLILLRPKDRMRRIRLIDAIFCSPARGSKHRRGDL